MHTNTYTYTYTCTHTHIWGAQHSAAPGRWERASAELVERRAASVRGERCGQLSRIVGSCLIKASGSEAVPKNTLCEPYCQGLNAIGDPRCEWTLVANLWKPKASLRC